MMRKKRNSVILLLMMVLALLAGCAAKKREKKEDEIYLYYADKNQTGLVSVLYKPENTEPLAAAGEVLEKMNETSKETGCITAKPATVIINDIQYEDMTLKIDFGDTYMDMNNVTELLCRSAIVLTLTQLNGIDSVSFTVGGEYITDSANMPVGRMTANDFIDNGESDINSYRQVKVEVFFSNSKETGLVPVTYDEICDSNTSVEKLIIERLLKGPDDSRYVKTIPSGVRLVSVLTKDGICYVNFDAAFLTEKSDVTSEFELYSIVNSLCELSYINKVQISVNGNTDKKLRDEISLVYPFSRNLDIVVNEE